jgi:predicted DNA-binding transcriptional regulator AlpA
MTVQPGQLLDSEELAARLGVTPASLRTMRSRPQRHRTMDGIPAPLRLVSGRPVWRTDDIDRWLDS